MGPLGGGAAVGYGAVGRVVAVAEALQSRAGLGSALVGPATHRAVEGLLEWGRRQDVALRDDEKPIVAVVAGRPKARTAGGYPGLSCASGWPRG